MLLLAPEGKFSRNYESARQRFLAAAGNVGARLLRYNIESQTDLQSEWTTDIAWLGSDQPRKAVLIISGIHGVEGFAGSAIQLANLEVGPLIPPDTALVMVHILNPYGMEKGRRVNSENVDLNRNFVFDPDGFQGAPEAYISLDAFLNPPMPPSRDLFSLKLLFKKYQYGRAALTQAIAGGQYAFPKGLFFGGNKWQPETVGYMEWLKASPLREVDQLLVIDLHTGLGAFGEQSLYLRSDHMTSRELSQKLRLRVLPDGKNSGAMVYDHVGGSSGVYNYLFPQAKTACLTVEYGTYPVHQVLEVLRAENQNYHFGDNSPAHWSKRKLKDAFCPHPDIWRKRVVIQGLALIERSLGAVTDGFQ